jgi:hypothetical protein
VLERHSEALNRDIKKTLGELTVTEARVMTMLPPRRLPSTQSSIVARVLDTPDPLARPMETVIDDGLLSGGGFSDPRLGVLKGTISRKSQELSRLEHEQKQKLDELQAQLSIARAIYTPNHPTVQSLQQSVAAFQYTSPQVRMLRSELDRLETEADDQAALVAERLISEQVGRRGATAAPQPRLMLAAPAQRTPEPSPDTTGLARPDAVAEFATLTLRRQLNELRSILERTDAARIEFEVSKAAFKHRYSVVSPAEEPGDPSFPETRAVLAAGLLASMLFAIFSAIAADVLSNRLLEPWQVQRLLGIPVLGTVRTS